MLYKYRKIYTWQCRYILHIGYFNWVERFQKIDNYFFGAALCDRFYDDWKHQYIKNIVIRTGRRNYIISKIVVCVSISFLVVFLGILIFIGLLIGMGFDYSGINGMGLDENMPYGIFLYQKSFLYVCCIVSIYAASMAVWVMSGLMISSYIPNSFVAICSPLIFSYLLEEITGLLPPYFNMYLLAKASNVLGKNATYSYLYTIFIFTVLILGQGLIFAKRVKRRLGNEIS